MAYYSHLLYEDLKIQDSTFSLHTSAYPALLDSGGHGKSLYNNNRNSECHKEFFEQPELTQVLFSTQENFHHLP